MILLKKRNVLKAQYVTVREDGLTTTVPILQTVGSFWGIKQIPNSPDYEVLFYDKPEGRA